MSSNRHLHVIAFDVPYPPNYGGVIDVYYKLVELKKLQIKVHLHCFEYGRPRNNALDKVCENVTYYKRDKNKALLFSKIPYIVVSRLNQSLLENLAKDNNPILCEGLHTTGILNYQDLNKRKVFVRAHNIEHDYYLHLAKNESKLAHKLYYKREAKKLKRYESILEKCTGIFSISPNDTAHFKKKNKNVTEVYPFHPFHQVNCKSGKGDYAVYHGNLKVNENNTAALFLCEAVFNDSLFPLLVTGSGATNYLKHVISENDHIELKENVSSDQMLTYLQNAHIHVLPTFQATGMKLKLISALFNGRYCLVNNEMVENTGIEELCEIANGTEAFKVKVKELSGRVFPKSEIEKRKKILSEHLNNEKNANKIVDQIFATSSPS